MRARWPSLWLGMAILALWLPPAGAQQLLDRVVARVGRAVVTLTDVNAAVGLGLVNPMPGEAPMDAAVRQLIDRQLVLIEVARFPPPDPAPAAIEAEVAAMKARAGDRLETLMRDTGLDETRLHDLARETLRMQGYIDQRFGTSVQLSQDEVRRYYDTHP